MHNNDFNCMHYYLVLPNFYCNAALCPTLTGAGLQSIKTAEPLSLSRTDFVIFLLLLYNVKHRKGSEESNYDLFLYLQGLALHK